MTKKPLNLFFLCEVIDFYSESGSWMNNLYEVGTKIRHTWSDAEQAIKEGRKVNVRAAKPAEIVWAYQKLASYQMKHIRYQVEEKKISDHL